MPLVDNFGQPMRAQHVDSLPTHCMLPVAKPARQCCHAMQI